MSANIANKGNTDCQVDLFINVLIGRHLMRLEHYINLLWDSGWHYQPYQYGRSSVGVGVIY